MMQGLLTIADFTKCLEATNGDMTSCNYYLEALSKLYRSKRLRANAD